MRSIVAACLALMLPAAYAAGPSPGETSGAPLAPLVVAEYDKASGDMRLAYQTGCGTIDNNIHYGPLSDVSSLGFSGSVCGIGTTGSYSGFNPGPGSYFFLIVGNDGVHEGSYGQAVQGGTSAERFPYVGSTCGEVQQLADACTPAPQGGACSDSGDCGPRQTCLENATGGGQCVCLDPFTGAYCDVCAPGYAGVDCRECAPGYSSNLMELSSGSDASEDLTDPSRFHCELDVTGSCAGVQCSGSGVCEVVGQDGYCACDPGYTGSDCSECAPNFELDAAGACVLGDLCRDAKCGGHGACVATGFGDVTCACDSGYGGTDCGGPALAIHTDSETFSLYDGQSIVLVPVGGTGPFTWQVEQGPAHVTACPVRDPGCPVGGARLTIEAPSGGIQDLMLVKVKLYQPGGGQANGNYAALPQTMVPFTGTIHEELMPYYSAMLKYMRARGIRAGMLGISRGGVLVGVNGYGYRDSGLDDDPWVHAGEGGPLVQPNSPFRVGSLSKVLTAAAVRGAAVDAGVDITSASFVNRAAHWIDESIGFDPATDTPPFNYDLGGSPESADFRWDNVTIEHLLNHHAGYYRDGASVAVSTNGMPKYNGDKLPFTQDLDDPNELQTVSSGTDSDISAALVYALAALQAGDDPRPTVDKVIKFSTGIRFHYAPGGAVDLARNYSNIGYIMLSRILEGLKGRSYDPDEPGVPMGWGAYPELLQDYLCESSGIVDGVFPGDAFNQQPLEPYYRGLSWDGIERMDWNLAQGAEKIRFDGTTQRWQFCQSGCPAEPGAVWNLAPNAPRAYGGVWLAERNGAGGLAVNAEALLKFARNHRVKVGTPNEDPDDGIGLPLLGPGSYPSPSSSHSGQSAGARAWLIQWGGDEQSNQLPEDTGAWNSDPAAPLDLDQGKVVVAENVVVSKCTPPNNVALAVAFNQDADQRAPWENVSGQSTSGVGTVYGRIIDFLGDATCQVAAGGWPALGDLPAQQPPVCN